MATGRIKDRDDSMGLGWGEGYERQINHAGGEFAGREVLAAFFGLVVGIDLGGLLPQITKGVVA